MIKLLFLAALSLTSLVSVSQVTIEQCYKAARENYPSIKQYALIEQAAQYDLRNAAAAWYPSASLSAKATYQSAVTTVPIPSVEPQSKDQYQVALELNQTIWDGGVTSSKKNAIHTSSQVDVKRLDVDLYALNDRVNNLFFGILTLDEQLAVNALLDQELGRQAQKVAAYIDGGIANSADLDAVQVEIIDNRQQRIEIQTSRSAYCRMLTQMTGLSINKLTSPTYDPSSKSTINRPELALFDAQKNSALSKETEIRASTMPRLGAFIQGAYGSPGLDMLKAGFTPFAIGGVNLKWNISSFYTTKTDRAKIRNYINQIQTSEMRFLHDLRINMTQNQSNIERLELLMVDDEQIITLRGNIKRSAEAKVQGGIMSVIDMLREVTNENAAIAARSAHRVELLKAQYDLKYITNN